MPLLNPGTGPRWARQGTDNATASKQQADRREKFMIWRGKHRQVTFAKVGKEAHFGSLHFFSQIRKEPGIES